MQFGEFIKLLTDEPKIAVFNHVLRVFTYCSDVLFHLEENGVML